MKNITRTSCKDCFGNHARHEISIPFIGKIAVSPSEVKEAGGIDQLIQNFQQMDILPHRNNRKFPMATCKLVKKIKPILNVRHETIAYFKTRSSALECALKCAITGEFFAHSI